MSKQAKVLNEAEIKRVKAVIRDNRYATRNLTMFVLALNVGLRAKELASIKVGDVLTKSYIKKIIFRKNKETAHQYNRRTSFKVIREDYVANPGNEDK